MSSFERSSIGTKSCISSSSPGADALAPEPKGARSTNRSLLPGSSTDITVSRDNKWLAVIYSATGGGHIAVYAIDAYGDLSLTATSSAIGVAGFNGVALSE